MNKSGLHILELPYTKAIAIELFSSLSRLPWALLLNSTQSNHLYSRFDIIVADPIATLVTAGNKTLIRQGQITFSSDESPFSLVQKMIEKNLAAVTTEPNLPFQGGAVGVFGYDLGRCFETIPIIAKQDIAFPDMMVGIYDWALIADHHKHTLTLISHSDIKKRKNWLFAHVNMQSQIQPFHLTSHWQSNLTFQQYTEKFAVVKDHLLRGDCYQINLTQRFQATYQGDEWHAFLLLMQENQAPFSAFLRFPKYSLISLSPERFISLSNRNIQTRPIKGTAPRHPNAQQDVEQAKQLLNSTKNQAENLMIVDLLRNDIGRIAVPGTVAVPELFALETFPAVHHLVSTITAELPEDKFATDLLQVCFPGGSITGAPKVKAMEIIEAIEPQRRNIYCGSIGYISCCGSMDTNIAIRTLLTENDSIYCWAGGGIVFDSDVDDEYQESFAKLNRILKVLQKREKYV